MPPFLQSLQIHAKTRPSTISLVPKYNIAHGMLYVLKTYHIQSFVRGVLLFNATCYHLYNVLYSMYKHTTAEMLLKRPWTYTRYHLSTIACSWEKPSQYGLPHILAFSWWDRNECYNWYYTVYSLTSESLDDRFSTACQLNVCCVLYTNLSRLKFLVCICASWRRVAVIVPQLFQRNLPIVNCKLPSLTWFRQGCEVVSQLFTFLNHEPWTTLIVLHPV